MVQNKIIDTMWDESPVDVTQEANFIWSIANKLRGSYMPDKYGDVIIPMTIIRRFECALEENKAKVVALFKQNPNHPAKALCKTLCPFLLYDNICEAFLRARQCAPLSFRKTQVVLIWYTTQIRTFLYKASYPQ